MPCPAVVCIIFHSGFEAVIAVFGDGSGVIGHPVVKVVTGNIEFCMKRDRPGGGERV